MLLKSSGMGKKSALKGLRRVHGRYVVAKWQAAKWNKWNSKRLNESEFKRTFSRYGSEFYVRFLDPEFLMKEGRKKVAAQIKKQAFESFRKNNPDLAKKCSELSLKYYMQCKKDSKQRREDNPETIKTFEKLWPELYRAYIFLWDRTNYKTNYPLFI